MFSAKLIPLTVKLRDVRTATRLLHSLHRNQTIAIGNTKKIVLPILRLQQILQLHTTNILCEQKNDQSDKEKGEKSGSKMNMASAFGIWFLSGAIAIGFFIASMDNNTGGTDKIKVTAKEFLEEVLPSGEVQRIIIIPDAGKHSVIAQLHNGAILHGNRLADPRPVIKVTGIRDIEDFEDTVRNAEKRLGLSPTDRVNIERIDVDPTKLIGSILMLLILLGLIGFLFSRVRIKTVTSKDRIPEDIMSMMGVSGSALKKKIETGVKFVDVAGCAEAKQEVMEFVHYLKNPEKYQKLGAKMPRGCLLTGPPGVGKTMLAKAVATESGVPFLSKAGSDFVEIIGGLGARRVRDLFKEARSVAPCIVYIDELDAVGAERSFGESSVRTGSSERDQTLNQILVEMDGILSAAHNVVVMASTNRADMLDKALLRPGRFDRHIAIDLPTKIERKEIFEQHLKGLKLKQPYSTYSERLANLSPGMSGADIANICNEAAICAAREKSTSIDVEHFEQAFERFLAGSRKKSSALSPEERRIIAFHEAGHALVGWMLKHTDALIKVSIVPRTKSTLGFTRTLPKEHKLYTRAQLMDFMSMRLAGRAAENLVFGTVTQGAEDDLKKVTDIAYSQVKQLGLSPAIGNISFANDDESFTKPFSDAFAHKMDKEVTNTVYEAHKIANDILEKNRDKLDVLARELLNKEVLNYDDIVRLIGPPPHGNKLQVHDIDVGSFEPSAT